MDSQLEGELEEEVPGVWEASSRSLSKLLQNPFKLMLPVTSKRCVCCLCLKFSLVGKNKRINSMDSTMFINMVLCQIEK